MTYFPSMMVDEILISAIARFQTHTLNFSLADTTARLFGKRLYGINIGLPYCLKGISNNIGPATFDDLLNKHTLWPYYSSFLTLERRQDALNKLQKNQHHNFHSRIASLKYCPLCFENQKSLLERYWLRVHQIPSLLVCPYHNCWLQVVDVFDGNHRIQNANSILHGTEPVVYNTSKCLAELAILQKQLLLDECKIDILKYNYRDRLLALRTPQSVIKERFIEFYGLKNLLILVERDSEFKWIRNFIRSQARYADPVKLILFYYFFESTLESIRLERVLNPFGEGPWECINPAAEHFGGKVIQRCTEEMEPKSGRIIYTFNCECGMVYTKSINNASGSIRINKRIKEFGTIWKKALIQQLLKGLPFDLIGKNLKVSTATVFTFSKELLGDQAFIASARNLNSLIKKNRMQWVDLVSTKSLELLKSEEFQLHDELKKHDYEWFKVANKILGKKGNPNQTCLAFEKKDLSELVDKVVLRLKRENYNGRITMKIIKSVIWDEDLVLDVSQRILNAECRTAQESISEFQNRRINNAYKELIGDGAQPSKWKVMQKAGIRKPVAGVVDLLENLSIGHGK